MTEWGNKVTPVRHTGRWTIASFALPFVAWFIGAAVNPDGWASDYPQVVVALPLFLAMSFWYVTVAVMVVIALIMFKVKGDSGKVLMPIFVGFSIIYSVYTLMWVASAEEHEFAG